MERGPRKEMCVINPNYFEVTPDPRVLVEASPYDKIWGVGFFSRQPAYFGRQKLDRTKFAW